MVNVAAHKRDGLVKVCGVTSIEDAELAASSGKGIILICRLNALLDVIRASPAVHTVQVQI